MIAAIAFAPTSIDRPAVPANASARFHHAILRAPAANFAAGLTTARWSAAPDFARLQAQHRAYAEALRAAGLSVEILPPLPEHPDAYFVEDVAVVVPELAVITRPGAEARRGEAPAIVEALAARGETPRAAGFVAETCSGATTAAFRLRASDENPGARRRAGFHHGLLARQRPLATIEAPAILDGGDVMVIDRQVFVGLSARSDQAGVDALADVLAPHGYTITAVPVTAGLHLKSSVNWIGPGLLLATPGFAAHPAFAAFEIVVTAPGEEAAANALWINDRLLIAAGFPQLRAALRARGLTPIELDMSEVAKMDGGLSCLSLRL